MSVIALLNERDGVLQGAAPIPIHGVSQVYRSIVAPVVVHYASGSPVMGGSAGLQGASDLQNVNRPLVSSAPVNLPNTTVAAPASSSAPVVAAQLTETASLTPAPGTAFADAPAAGIQGAVVASPTVNFSPLEILLVIGVLLVLLGVVRP